jgi:4-amino-4-deoxychorismate lyase
MNGTMLIDGRPSRQLPADDRGLLYGDGLFETIRCEGGRPRWLSRHWQRLSAGAARLHLPEPDLAALSAEVAQLAAGHARCLVKVVLTRGVGQRGYRPTGLEHSTRVVAWHDWPTSTPAALQLGRSTVPLGENPRLAGIKHLNRLEQVLAQLELQPGLIDEVIMFASSRLPVCGSMSNLFVCQEHELLTPAVNSCGVAGVMRALVLEAAAALAVPLRIVSLREQDLARATGLFMTNVRWGLMPVAEYGGRRLPADERVQLLWSWIDAQD